MRSRGDRGGTFTRPLRGGRAGRRRRGSGPRRGRRRVHARTDAVVPGTVGPGVDLVSAHDVPVVAVFVPTALHPRVGKPHAVSPLVGGAGEVDGSQGRIGGIPLQHDAAIGSKIIDQPAEYDDDAVESLQIDPLVRRRFPAPGLDIGADPDVRQRRPVPLIFLLVLGPQLRPLGDGMPTRQPAEYPGNGQVEPAVGHIQKVVDQVAGTTPQAGETQLGFSGGERFHVLIRKFDEQYSPGRCHVGPREGFLLETWSRPGGTLTDLNSTNGIPAGNRTMPQALPLSASAAVMLSRRNAGADQARGAWLDQ